MNKLVPLLIVAWLGGVASAQPAQPPPQARLQLESRNVYAGMPFNVLVVAQGFAEDPAPAQPTLVVDGAKVTPLGVEPQVTQMDLYGQRFDRVTWVFRWRVEAPKAGTFTVQPVTIVQGATKAEATGGNLEVTAIEATDDMQLEVIVPDRPVWLGEVVPVHIDWKLRKDVEDQQLSVPLLAMPDDFAVTAPPATDPRRVLPFPAGATDLQLPFEQDSVDGYTRFRFTVLVTPLRAGTITLEPAQVVASLQVGTSRDRLGFPVARTQLFRAIDAARTIEVKPLPQQGRPASFAGAVGSSFSIAARLSRSVVQLGEPVDLELTIVGDTRLEGLTLGALGGPGRLPAERFAMPDTTPPGVLSDDGKSKVFTVAIQVTDPTTTEIPPIELAWFDPATGQYRTTTSDPIALSVKGGTVVGAADVKGGVRKPAGGDAPATSDVSLVGADLALSAPGAALDHPLRGAALWGLVLALYLVPLGVFGLRWWQLRTAGAREEAGEVAAARKKVDAELARAATVPGRESAAPLGSAIRTLRKLLAQTGGDDVLARIETEGFARAAGEQPLSAPLRADAAALVKRWHDERRGRKKLPVAVVLLIGLGARQAHADAVEDGRSAYSEALATPDPTKRQAAFARAADAFGEAAKAHPDSPDLLADWGNAALGAADFGTATLAFRRALRIDGDHARAHKNLAWLRGRLAVNLQPHEGGAASALFFFHDTWRRSTRLLVGAGAFAIMALLLVPWRRRPGGGRLALAVIPAVVWLLMTGSVLLQGDAGADGVVLDAQVLRAADQAGAPAVQATPLPPGVEVTILERRPGWARVRTAGGATGWLPSTSVVAVVP